MKKDWFAMVPFIGGAILLIFGGWLIETPLLDSVPEKTFKFWYQIGIFSIVIGSIGVVIGCFLLINIWNRKN